MPIRASPAPLWLHRFQASSGIRMVDQTPVCLPRINEPAPSFTALSTHGEISLEDFRGKWIVFFSHPADFTPICTSEFAAFARHQARFEAIGVQLIALSADSVYSHIAWAEEIEEHFGEAIRFPVVADVGLDVSRAYGMVHVAESRTSTVRALFVVCPRGLIRAINYYPLAVGRDVEEVFRLVRALQVNLEHGLSTPEGWRPGDDCIVPPPVTTAAAKQRIANQFESRTWYFSTTECPLGVPKPDVSAHEE